MVVSAATLVAVEPAVVGGIAPDEASPHPAANRLESSTSARPAAAAIRKDGDVLRDPRIITRSFSLES